MNLEQVGEHRPQDACYQDTQEGARHRREAPAVKAVDQCDDEHGEEQRDQQPHPDGIPPLEIQGDQHLPQRQHRQGKGGQGPDACFPCKQDQQQGKAHRHHQLPVQAVVVGHGDIGDGIPIVADDHLGHIPGGEDLVLLQGAVEHIDAHRRLSLEAAAQNLQLTPLLAGADQSRVDNGGIIHRENPSGAPLSLLIVERILIPGGQEEQNHNRQQAHQHRHVVAQGF